MNIGKQTEHSCKVKIVNESAPRIIYGHWLVSMGYFLMLFSFYFWNKFNIAIAIVIAGFICMATGVIASFRKDKMIAVVLGLLGCFGLIAAALILAMIYGYSHSHSAGWG